MTGTSAPGDVVHLGIDIGTSNTAAAVRGRDGQVRPVLFDGALLLPSAVFADGDSVLVGLDAQHAATTRPALLEPNPKRCIDDVSVLLGDTEVAVEALLAAILRRVRDAAAPAAGLSIAVTLTYPVAWGARRLAVLTDAARLAGLPTPTTVYEPVAAAAHFVGLPDVDLAEGQLALVYDLGAGTFDATVIRRTAVAFEVVASQGLPDAGGLDIDAAIVASIRANLRPGDDAWRFLRQPLTMADLRNRRTLMDGIRGAKEALSRTSSASIHIPVLDAEVPLGREQFEALARPVLDRTVAATRAVLRDAGVAESDLAAILLVGGSTRIPLVGTLLHRAFGRPPVALDQPELAVAYGSVAGDVPHLSRAVSADSTAGGTAVAARRSGRAGAPGAAGAPVGEASVLVGRRARAGPPRAGGSDLPDRDGTRADAGGQPFGYADRTAEPHRRYVRAGDPGDRNRRPVSDRVSGGAGAVRRPVERDRAATGRNGDVVERDRHLRREGRRRHLPVEQPRLLGHPHRGRAPAHRA